MELVALALFMLNLTRVDGSAEGMFQPPEDALRFRLLSIQISMMTVNSSK
ncbi:hypothetical protein KC19_8G124600 [Ceratodon purpureus]|uniref:Uncharacterized protein n=1 Tax=Ceratodon purpureus TaxID=3225 RepID=A0A8T0H0F4_CERPU|nr:hypothetical protein KC19_8G124600 [Ceratodon purpureus]